MVYRSLCVAVALALTGCGGSGGGTNSAGSPPPIVAVPSSYTLSGAAVKGPWQNAEINIYEMDFAASDKKGKKIASVRTAATGQFSGLKVEEPKASYYVVQALADAQTTELITGQKPYAQQLTTIVSAAEIKANKVLYLTPLSTLVTEMMSLQNLTDASVQTLLGETKNKVIATVGFNLNPADDLLKSSPLLMNSSSVAADFRFRQANEALAVTLFHLLAGSSLSFDQGLKAVARDIADGQLDALEKDQPSALLQAIPDYLQKLQQTAIRHQLIPHTAALTAQSKDLTLDNLALLLQKETASLSSAGDAAAIQAAAQQFKIASFGADLDQDGYPDAVDADDDNDGFNDSADVFPRDKTEWLDTDSDGKGNNADTDDDNDGVIDAQDAFPLNSAEQLDTDNDGIGNNADTDDDSDGKPDAEDAFPLDKTEWLDTDSDGVGNNTDTDDDNDNYPDLQDAFPLNYAEWLDTDGDGVGNNGDQDDDNDGVIDTVDLFPLDASESSDYDADGIGDNKDTDRDNDGIADRDDPEMLSTVHRNQPVQLDRAYLQSIAGSNVTITENATRIIIQGGTVHLPTTTQNARYVLSKSLQVGQDKTASAILRISPGATLAAANSAVSITVSRGSKLIAYGYKHSPITLTSEAEFNGLVSAAGQWGGLSLMGKAKDNSCSSPSDSCSIQAPGQPAGVQYGGDDDRDYSGILRYLRIKNAGSRDTVSSSTHAALELFAVGSATELSYIHIDKTAGDGVALYGGTAQLSHLIVTASQDDSFDWTSGYRGKLQYALLQQAADDSQANRAIEADNRADVLSAEPISNPTLSNLTIIGNAYDGSSDDSEGILFRRNSHGYISNSIITGPPLMGECLDIDADTTAAATAGAIKITHTVMACENGENFKYAVNFNYELWFLSQAGNSVAAGRTEVLDGIYSITKAAAADLSGSDAFFEKTDFIGAVSKKNDWTQDWSLLPR